MWSAHIRVGPLHCSEHQVTDSASRKEEVAWIQELDFPWAQEARQTTRRCVSTVGRDCWHISLRKACGFCLRTGSLQHWAPGLQTPITNQAQAWRGSRSAEPRPALQESMAFKSGYYRKAQTHGINAGFQNRTIKSSFHSCWCVPIKRFDRVLKVIVAHISVISGFLSPDKVQFDTAGFWQGRF